MKTPKNVKTPAQKEKEALRKFFQKHVDDAKTPQQRDDRVFLMEYFTNDDLRQAVHEISYNWNKLCDKAK